MRHHGSWWVENYGIVSAEEDPLVSRAYCVFERVSMAADKMGNRIPRLIIIKGKGDPWAISLKDDSIILTHGALRLCYKGVTEEDGSSRLAFLLGHELAHLSNGDFWHTFAFTAVEENLNNKEIKKALKALLEETGDVRANDPESDKFIRAKELQADSYGIIYMAIAGYNPRTIVDGNFFKEWVTQINSVVAYEDPHHPGPEIRSEFLKSQLSTVVKVMDYFTFGVYLYQLGRYSDAILFLDSFSEHFPGREVFNNLGLCHYQLAMRFLLSCNSELPLRFKLSTIIDTETHASKIKGKYRSDCLRNRIFVQHINNAIGYLNLSLNKDPTYLPARINLSSALIMAGKYSSAIGAADEALEIDPGNPDALNNKAIALYLFGLTNNIDMADTAISILKEISSSNPDFPSLIYNIATIQSERGRRVSAHKTWKAFLSIETRGLYADVARRNLGIEDKKAKETNNMPDKPKIRPPIEPGEIKGKLADVLDEMESREFVIGKFTGKIYEGKNIKVLVIDNMVELVKTQLDEALDVEEFKKKYGDPERVKNGNFHKILLYNHFAIDAYYGKIKNIIYF